MRLRVHKQHADTYKCQRGDQHSRSHKELRSEHPQSTIRMKRGIVSRYLRSAGETFKTDNARRAEIRHVRRKTVYQSAKGCRQSLHGVEPSDRPQAAFTSAASRLSSGDFAAWRSRRFEAGVFRRTK